MKKISLFSTLLFLSICALISNYQVFYMNIDQQKLLDAVIYSTYEPDLEFYQKLESGYPTLTATAIPFKSVLGAYWINQDSISKAIKFLREGEKYNPFLGFSDMVFANIWDTSGNIDSMSYYTRRASSKLPNAPSNYILLSKIYLLEDKIDSLDMMFTKISSRVRDPEVWKVYLSAMVSNKGEIDSIKVLNYAKEAKIEFSELQIQLLANYIIYGEEIVKKNIELKENAVKIYNEDPDLSIEMMQQAVKSITDNVKNYETLIEMLFFQQRYSDVIENYKTLLTLGLNTVTYKTVELIAISYLNLNDIQNGCLLAQVLKDGKQKYSSSIDLVCK
jgi:tetratricopeptide (TPR) repeat protein